MNAKAIQALEFHKITEQLSGYAGSAPAKRMCLSLRPSRSPEWILRAQDETAAALARLLRSDRLSFGGNEDLREYLAAAAKGHSLSTAELLCVARLLSCVEQAQLYDQSFDEEHDGDCLREYFERLDPLLPLCKEIERCILSEDEIADDASGELKKIRGSYAVLTERIRRSLQQMVSQTYHSYLQDHVITMRAGRYCLPVKAEYKSQVPGIVLDQSSTGSTCFIEPSAIVELDNKLTQLHLDEEAEIRRILSALSLRVGQSADVINEDQRSLTLLDFIFAKARYALHTDATRPVYATHGMEAASAPGTPGAAGDQDAPRIRLRKARHPLLDASTAVPIDVTLGIDYDLLIVTGPNTGGKTVSLKTVGLLTLMGQAGLHIPAHDRSELSIFDEVYADIGDEQSIEQSLSTFSSHMTQIVQILKRADDRSLCLFDELGAGTDPTEGAALAMAILSHLHERGIRTMATTHYSELKVYALTTPGVENASCEFDVESLSPTYRLLTGIPGKSNAFAISRKLGLPQEIVDQAGGYLSKEQERFEDVISDLESRRVRLEDAQDDMEQRLAELHRREQAVRAREDKVQGDRDAILRKAREEARELLREAKTVADDTIRAFHKQGDQMRIQTMERKRGQVREWISKQDEAIYRDAMRHSRKAAEDEGTPSRRLSVEEAVPGAEVYVCSLRLDGTITAAPDRKGRVSVQCGAISTKVPLSDLRHATAKPADTAASKARRGGSHHSVNKTASVSAEINVIGCTVDEALHRIDKYLDDVALSNLESVRIVHGKGSGALRSAIHEYLNGQPFVKSYALAEHGEGDAGVTVVKLS